jgi:hypothetical protein
VLRAACNEGAIGRAQAGATPGGADAGGWTGRKGPALTSRGVAGGEAAESSPAGVKGEPGRVPVPLFVSTGEAVSAETVRASSCEIEEGWSEPSSSRRMPAGSTQALSHPAAATETIRCSSAILALVTSEEGRVAEFELYS